MDTKIEIIEKVPLSENIAPQNQTEFFTKNVTMNINSSAVFLDNDCDVTIKTDFKSDTPFPEFCLEKERECFSKHFVKHIKSEAVTCSNTKIVMKTEIEEQTWVSDFISHNEREFLPEDPVMKFTKYNNDHQMDNKVEIKQEPCWLETDTSSVCDDIKDGDFAPVKSSRFHTKAVSGDSCGDSPLASTEPSERTTSFSYEKDPEHEGQESDVRNILPVEKHVHSEQLYKCSDRGKFCSRRSLIHNVERSHKCNICDKNFAHLSQGKRFHKCEICEKNFTNLSSLKRHNLIHEGKKPHKCEICEKSFRHISHLKRHNLKHEDKNPHKCEICEKNFTQMSHLKEHNLIHEGIKPHKCEICKKNFTHISSFKRHNLIHEGKKPHKCRICEKSFTQISHLKRHNLIHGKMPFKCEICEKSFIQMSHLKSHNLIHEGKKPHKCVICEKSFTRLSYMKLHNLIHEGKKPHKCEICEKSFTQVSNLKKHNLIHAYKTPDKCGINVKRFTGLLHLKRHNFIPEDENLISVNL